MIKDQAIYIVATETDGDHPLFSDGPMVHETYTAAATLEKALERAERLRGRFGRAYVLRCEIMGTANEIKTAIPACEE